MGRTLRKFPGQNPEDIENLSKAMKRLIVRTIECTLPLRASGGTIHPPPPYPSFAELIHYLTREARPVHTVSVITFNYDMAADYGLHSHGLGVDYGLETQENPGRIPLLKLHGSLNWAHCQQCDQIVPWTLQRFFSGRTWRIFDDRPRLLILAIGSKIAEFKHDDHGVQPEPFIVPPTWNKEDYHRQLTQVWSRAATELGKATDIFIIGYSYPGSDAFFHYLYALGTVGGPLLERIWVFNPDETVDGRFRELLGPGARARYRYLQNTFSEAIVLIKSEFSQSR